MKGMDPEQKKEQETEKEKENSTNSSEENNSENGDKELASKKKSANAEPSLNDYLAGAMLANGIIWIWLQFIQIFGSRISQYSYLADLSYILFIFAGYIAAFQVGKRVDTEHLTVGLKTAGYSLIMALIIMYTSWPAPSSRLAFTLMICLVFGGVVGGYMNIRRRIKIKRRLREASS
jgi:cation transport ATPase